MSYIPTENLEVDEKGKQVSRDWLRLPTILRKILEQFSTEDLVELSLVNKLWNFEARSVMRERGNISAELWYGGADDENLCQKLLALSSALEKMRVVPFSGIKFAIYDHKSCQSISTGSIQQQSYNVILNRLPWKHFCVSFVDHRDSCKACPALSFVKAVLQDYSGVLEELTVGYGNEEFYQNVLQGRTLPNLKVLKVEKTFGCTENVDFKRSFIKNLVSRVPNLKELHVDDGTDLATNILEGSSAVLVLHDVLFPLYQPICKNLVSSIRTETMSIFLQEDDHDSELLNKFIPELLNASRPTLKTFRMDLLFAVPLMCYGICLENVTTLDIYMNCHSLKKLEPSILKLPTGLDFTRVFPKLDHVTILDNFGQDFSSDLISAFVEQGNEVLSRASPDRAVNIKLLDLERCGTIEGGTIPLLAKMFPEVKTVHTKRQHRGALFEDLREHFERLEEVTESEIGIAL